ncbi:hypothetical protein Vadar_029236 [Vaccinium darrowii]|uniref:Uncharacterized protein n=1 Tax=Vaccinium darrowii TaxID=229202 RepID=A0ACB7ZMD9_9ERIC|nr:hypothetical protein Vadar_029236 [Vaccinium darrowii]
MGRRGSSHTLHSLLLLRPQGRTQARLLNHLFFLFGSWTLGKLCWNGEIISLCLLFFFSIMGVLFPVDSLFVSQDFMELKVFSFPERMSTIHNSSAPMNTTKRLEVAANCWNKI